MSEKKARQWNVVIGSGNIIYEGWLVDEPFEVDPKMEVAVVREVLPDPLISEEEIDEAYKIHLANKECNCDPSSFYFESGSCPYHDESYDFYSGYRAALEKMKGREG